jgi:hypothetical protein
LGTESRFGGATNLVVSRFTTLSGFADVVLSAADRSGCCTNGKAARESESCRAAAASAARRAALRAL